LQRYAALPEVWAVIAFLICICTLLTFPIMNAWQRHVGATAAGLIYCAEPVLAGLYCTLLPALLARWMRVDYANEVLSAEFLFGALLITVANVALQWRR
jgi:drug/metabolite transporter (DMT)-like permease